MNMNMNMDRNKEWKNDDGNGKGVLLQSSIKRMQRVPKEALSAAAIGGKNA